jgi:glucose/arabinose dehydrogenase/PKD repeat protein
MQEIPGSSRHHLPGQKSRFHPRNISVSNVLWHMAPMLAAGCLLFTWQAAAHADSPPDPPVIQEPPVDGAIVNGADLHMETAPMHDPDEGDTHSCSDWEIWSVTPLESAWIAACRTGLNRVHIHLGDGSFVNGHAGRLELFSGADYILRVRHRDGEGNWSAYSQRSFTTAPASVVLPMEIDDIGSLSLPIWNPETGGSPLILPGGEEPGFFRVETVNRDLLLELRGTDGNQNSMTNPPRLEEHAAVRILISGGSSSLPLPASRLTFADGSNMDHDAYFPSLNIAPEQVVVFWLSSNGSSYWGDLNQTEPDFSDLAHGSAVPWRVLQPGYVVETFASGFQLPVNIAFVPNPGSDPDDPYFYVTELYGNIKTVTRGGSVHDYASGLLNFDPTGVFPGSGEQGLSGICVEPTTGDLIVSLLYDAAPPDGPHYPKVIRLHSQDGGTTGHVSGTILDMPGELQGESHFVSNVSIGPDGKLYVHMGDGFSTWTALSLDSFRGKVIRLNLDGSASSDNPFYDAGNGISARDYIYAYGFRNPFGGAWRAVDGMHYEVENGPAVNDRLAKVVRGASYGWNGTDQSMRTNAIYNWAQSHAPVNMAFVQPETFGGSGFPSELQGHAFVTESGPTWATGPQERGKRIVEFDLAPDGTLRNGPTNLIEYDGPGKSTACGLAAGPDGLYFSDLYKDLGYQSAIDRGANILRVRFIGTADFQTSTRHGGAPLSVTFTDISRVQGAYEWHWNFGDGETSTLQNPTHVYSLDGLYDVGLQVTGTQGLSSVNKAGHIAVGNSPIGLCGEYFDSLGFAQTSFWRVDAKIDFPWYYASPDPSMGRETFSIRWSGRLRADYTENFTFTTTTDDGVRLWVGNQLIIDAWHDQAPTQHQGTASLVAGELVDIVMEYYDDRDWAVAKLEWESPSRPRQVIPPQNLYPVFHDVPAQTAEPSSPGPILERQPQNPIVARSRISIRWPSDGHAALVIYDVSGRVAKRLYSGSVIRGERAEFTIDPVEVPAGIYFLHLDAGGSNQIIKKLTILR